jgi:hypothetical protein
VAIIPLSIATKQREGKRKATVLALLERLGGATLEEIMAETAWQKNSVRGFISTLGRKHGYTVASIRRQPRSQSDPVTVFSTAGTAAAKNRPLSI